MAKGRILSKILTATNSIIDNDTLSKISAKRSKRIKSAIALSLDLAQDMEIPLKVTKKIINEPPWKFSSSFLDFSLSEFKKTNTSKEQFLCHWAEKKVSLKNNGWHLLYTDGSKSQNNLPAYAVVDDEGNLVAANTMFYNSSIFTTEACAIFRAIQHAIKSNYKTIILSDSLSVLRAIHNPLNNKWITIIKIRDALIKSKGNIRIHWVPSHIGISGNDKADMAAHYASRAPIILDDTVEKIDLHVFIYNYLTTKIKNNQSPHIHYANINPNAIAPLYPTDIDKAKIKVFSRLRLGHSFFSHNYLLNNVPRPICTPCNCSLTINHVLNDCEPLKHIRYKHLNKTPAFNILRDPSSTNINIIFNFIKETKLLV